MNSAAGAALIAGILSGVFVILGVVLGAWLQGRSTDREHARAAAAQRDEILAALSAAVSTLLTQAQLWRATASPGVGPAAFRFVSTPGRGLGLEPPDPRAALVAGELERLRNAIIPVINEISLFTNRLILSDPVLRPQAERLMSAVRALLANVGGTAERFRECYDELLGADRALRRKRDELAEQDRPQGWWARRRQQIEGLLGHQPGGHADDGPPDGKPQAS